MIKININDPSLDIVLDLVGSVDTPDITEFLPRFFCPFNWHTTVDKMNKFEMNGIISNNDILFPIGIILATKRSMKN